MIWDVRIPEKTWRLRNIHGSLKAGLPDEEIETGYGVKWQEQNIEYFKELAQNTNFTIINEWSKGEIFYLEMSEEE